MADQKGQQRPAVANWKPDHYIRSVLRYLDSSTDYREYLPPSRSGLPPPPPKDEFVTLDNEQFDWRTTGITIIFTVFICTLFLFWIEG